MLYKRKNCLYKNFTIPPAKINLKNKTQFVVEAHKSYIYNKIMY